MKKSITLLFIFLCTLSIIFITIFVNNKELVSKITIFLSALLSLLLAYLTGITKRKNGLINGVIIGISIATLSLVIHFIFGKEFFDLLYIRSLVIILSGASGGVIGVNKNIH